jgi:hypothetical protein
MALDPSIYARFAPAPKSVADFDREYEDVQGARQTNALNKLRLLSGQRQEQDAQRALQEQGGVRNALQALGGGATDEQRVNALRSLGTQTGFGQADALEKSLLERQKTRAEVESKGSESEKRQFEVARDRLAAWNNLLAGVADEASYRAAMPQAAALGVPMAQIPQQYDPNMVAAARQRALTEQQRLEAAARQRGHDLTQRGQDMTDARTRAEGAANRAVTMRGQSLTDDRARDLNVTAKTAAADAKKAAADEKAVTKFSDTLQKEGIPELETAIGGAEGAIGRYKEGEVPGVGRLAGAVPSALLGDEGNDVRQAIAAVRNIVLSARSGAAVTDQELRRLVEELGTGMGQSEAALRRGLQKVRARIDKIKENAAAGVNDDVLQTYQDRGGIAIKRGGKAAAPAAQAAAGGFKYLGTE